VEAIIELCRESGIEPDIKFTRPMIIHTTKVRTYRKEFRGYDTETILADSISWGESVPYFLLMWAGNAVKSSTWLSLDSLCIIYEEMKNVLRKL
jgi:hypothetical protein